MEIDSGEDEGWGITTGEVMPIPSGFPVAL